MARVNRLLELQDRLIKSDYRLILVQIQEAHTTLWPLGMDNHPEPQRSFEERLARAQRFTADYNIKYRVVVDPWGDTFEKRFHAWPDKYYLINPQLQITGKSEYRADSIVSNDYGELLENLLK